MNSCIRCNERYRESRARWCHGCHHEFCAACVRLCAACNEAFCDLHDCYHQHFLRDGCVPVQKSKRARLVVDEEDSDDLPILRPVPSMRAVQSASSLACTTSGGLRVELADGIDNFALLNDAVTDAFTPGGFSRLQSRPTALIDLTTSDNSATASRSPSPPRPRRSDRRRRIDRVYDTSYISSSAVDDECDSDNSSASSYTRRERRVEETTYCNDLLEGCIDLCAESCSASDTDDDDDDETSNSMAKFIMDDEEYERSLNAKQLKLYTQDNGETQEFLMQMRINFSTSDCDAFRIILYYLTRCVFDRTYARRAENAVKTSLCMESALMEGKVVKDMFEAPLYRAKAVMISGVWRQCVLDVMHSHSAIDVRPTELSLLSKKERAQMDAGDCRICHRRRHPIAKCMVLYNTETSDSSHPHSALFDDVRTLESCRYSWSIAGTDWVGNPAIKKCQFLCGVICAKRLTLYHELVHFWLKCAWLCYNTLKERGLSAKLTADRVRDGHEEALENRCWTMYKRLLDKCDAFTPSPFQKSLYENNE